MIHSIRIRVEGPLEEVQWVADALEVAFPSALRWHDSAKPTKSNAVSVSAASVALTSGAEAKS